MLDPSRWERVLRGGRRRLLTPVGLRSLAPGRARLQAAILRRSARARRAYHQGTVWAWLIGPFIDAWLKVHPSQRTRRPSASSRASPCHLDEACVGTISEIFDAEAPYTPRGCIAQAWSVAEVLRLLAKLPAPA